MACPNPFAVLRLRSEYLGPTLYTRASFRAPWLNLIPREEYGMGVGLAKSTFTVQRSEPTSDEENWAPLALAAGGGQLTTNTCQQTWNDTYVGYKELVHGPVQFALRGPLICQDDLVLHWQSADFWEKYFQALEKRNIKSLINRLGNIHMNFTPASLCGTSMDWTDPLHFYSPVGFTTVIPPQTVDITDLDPGSVSTGELTQDHLDETAVTLIQEGALDPNSNGWSQMGPSGPIFPLMIGMEASRRILLNNSEFRLDVRSGFDTFANANPLLERIGASLVIKNFRHMVDPFPPRWDWRTTGTDGSAIGPSHLYTEPNSGLIYGYAEDATQAAHPWAQQVHNGGCWVRRPVWEMSTDAGEVTKGKSAIVYQGWKGAKYEGAIVPSPWVFHEETFRPITAVGNAKWSPKNYMGEWQFVTGNDALINTADSCSGVTDPLHKLGRHFAEYKHAAKPIFPQYGRLIIFKRCLPSLQVVTCS